MNKLSAIAVAILSWLAFSAPAGVIVSHLNPPVAIFSGDSSLTAVPIDFNGDGIVDFRFLPGSAGVQSYIYIPTRVAILSSPPPNLGGSAGALPFNLTLGETGLPSGYRWYEGGALGSEFELVWGDKLISVLISVTTDPGVNVVAGDVHCKNAAIGVEFRIGTNTHYGYIHYDCRAENGFPFGGGHLRGWAYETEPGQPILTRPLADPELPTHTWITLAGPGAFELRWPSTPGGVYSVRGARDAAGPNNDVIAVLTASEDFSTFTALAPPDNPPSYFFRVVRVE